MLQIGRHCVVYVGVLHWSHVTVPLLIYTMMQKCRENFYGKVLLLVAIKRLTSICLTNSMTLSGEKYLTAIVVNIVYIEHVGALIATLWKFAWWNCPRKGWYEWF